MLTPKPVHATYAAVSYYTGQVAHNDGAPHPTPNEYYSQQGATPGHWRITDMTGLELPEDFPISNTVRNGARVVESQMLQLAAGMHPDTDRINKIFRARGMKSAFSFAYLGQGSRKTADRTAYALALEAAVKQWRVDNDQPVGAVPDEVRSNITTQLGREFFQAAFDRGPVDDTELSQYLLQISRPASQPVAFWDLVFSPVKSVSLLWALGDLDVSKRVEALHNQAVEEAMCMFEQRYLFTREGRGGVRQVKTLGSISAVFQHSESRLGDPDLHTHVVVASRVRSATSGKWLAVDGRDVFKGTVAVSEFYNTRIEALLSEEFGVAWRSVTHGSDKRITREIDGISDTLIDVFSKRNRGVRVLQAELVEQFRETHGRFPTKTEAMKLATTANLMLRPSKPNARSSAELRADWAAEAMQALTREARPHPISAILHPARRRLDLVAAMLFDALHPAARHHDPSPSWGDLAGIVLQIVSEERAAFSRNHVEAETWRQVRVHVAAADQRMAADFIVAEVLSRCVDLARPMLSDTPDVLTRAGAVSSYRHVNAELFTTRATLDAEQRIVDAAGQCDGWGVARSIVERVVADTARDGLELSASQHHMVTELACGTGRVRLALAPAGTGKTTTMRAFANVIRAAGGTVIGASHQAVAAHELRDALGETATSTTLASISLRIRGLLDWDEATRALVDSIDDRTVLIIDEAGMASTIDLDTVIGVVTARGGSVVLIGDDRQLASIGAGGVLRDINATHGSCTLRELRRFTSVSEGQATLALRDGNRDALGFYASHDRIHASIDVSVLNELFTAWQTDVSVGKKSLMLAHLHTDVDELNQMAQTWRRDLGIVDQVNTVALGDGSTCGVGDVVITRKNRRRLRTSATDFVKNQDRWIVTGVKDGTLSVVNESTRRRVILPAWYVEEFVTLGYASTINGAQGVTVTTCHTLFRGDEDLAGLYVPMSRGRESNHAYVVIGGDSDPHSVIWDDAARVQTAVEILAGIMEREDTNMSAGTIIRDHTNPFITLSGRTLIYYDALQQALIAAAGPADVAALTAGADTVLTRHYPSHADVRLSECAAWPALQQRLLNLYVDAGGGETGVGVALDALSNAVSSRGLFEDDHDAARDVAAVLCWRTDELHDVPQQVGPLPWLPGIPNALLRRLETMDSKWLPFLAAYHVGVEDAARSVEAAARNWAWDSAPRWTLPLLVNHRELVNDLAVWRAVNGVKDNELTPLGVAQPVINSVSAIQEHNRLAARLDVAVGAAAWEPFVTDEVLADPMWPVIASRLEAAVQHTIGGYGVPRDVLQDTLTRVSATTTAPIQYAASALWSLLIDQIETLIPSSVNMPAPYGATSRPLWAYQIIEHLPPGRSSDLYTSPMWPDLVDAVNTLDPRNLTSVLDIALTFAGDPSNRTRVDSAEAWIAQLINTLNRVNDVDTYGAAALDDTSPEPDEHLVSVEDEAFLAALLAEHDNAPASRRVTTDPHPEEPEDDPFTVLDMPTTSVERILELNQMASDYWAKCYPHSPAAAATQRRFGSTLAGDTRFGFGYAPPGWDHLIRHMTARGASWDELIDAGLAKHPIDRKLHTPMRNRLIDVFRNRIITTIRDTNGIIVGFSGRTLAEESEFNPKYMNTPTTAAFAKGSVFFGAHILEPDKQLVLVEGPMDAVAVTLTNRDVIGVAVGGTALTANQIDLLTPYLNDETHPLIVATDNDEAGHKAASRDHDLLTAAFGASIVTPRRMVFDDYKDPGEVIEDGHAELLVAALTHPDSLPTLASCAAHTKWQNTLAAHQMPGTDETLWSDKEHSELVDEAAGLLATLPSEEREQEAQRMAVDLYQTKSILEAPDLSAAVTNLITGLVYLAELKTPTPAEQATEPIDIEPEPPTTADIDPRWESMRDQLRASIATIEQATQSLSRNDPMPRNPDAGTHTPQRPRVSR
jgi:DNA primase catalytic core